MWKNCDCNTENSTLCKGYSKCRMISISQNDYGYQVNVGCQCISIESKAKLIALLTEYINDPGLFESKYDEGTLYEYISKVQGVGENL